MAVIRNRFVPSSCSWRNGSDLIHGNQRGCVAQHKIELMRNASGKPHSGTTPRPSPWLAREHLQRRPVKIHRPGITGRLASTATASCSPRPVPAHHPASNNLASWPAGRPSDWPKRWALSPGLLQPDPQDGPPTVRRGAVDGDISVRPWRRTSCYPGPPGAASSFSGRGMALLDASAVVDLPSAGRTSRFAPAAGKSDLKEKLRQHTD